MPQRWILIVRGIRGDTPHHRVAGRQQGTGEFVGDRQGLDRHLHVDDVLGIHPRHGGRADVVDPHGAVSACGVEPGHDPAGLIRPGRVIGHHRGVATGRLPYLQVVRERQDPLVPEGTGLFDDGTGAARVVQPHIGDGAALLLGGLRRDAGAGIGLGESAVLDEPLDA